MVRYCPITPQRHDGAIHVTEHRRHHWVKVVEYLAWQQRLCVPSASVIAIFLSFALQAVCSFVPGYYIPCSALLDPDPWAFDHVQTVSRMMVHLKLRTRSTSFPAPSSSWRVLCGTAAHPQPSLVPARHVYLFWKSLFQMHNVTVIHDDR